jgi:glutaminyl-tRNA synthetase
LHWVSAAHALPATVRLYDRLFTQADPMDAAEGQDFRSSLNPDSLETLTTCYVEPSLAQAARGSRWQFERLGYFCVDSRDSTEGALVFNRTVALRDSWAKIERAQKKRQMDAD